MSNKKADTTKKTVPQNDPRLHSKAQIFFTHFEPKQPNRFLVHMINEKKEQLIEPYLIKYIDRPGFTMFGGKKQWHSIKMRLYESIVPQHVLFRLLGAGVFDVQVDELSPVGDVIETWYVPHCRFHEVKAHPLDWASTKEPSEIQCELDWSEIIIKRGDSEFKIKK